MKVVVLGAGLVGGPMALDLAHDTSINVTVIDKDPDALSRVKDGVPSVATVEADLASSETVTNIVADFDYVLSAVPGFLGFQTLRACIAAGKNVVDIAFFAEDPFELDDLAEQNEVTVVVDCGVAPGMSNILIGHCEQQLDRIETATIYVGGIPELREWPYEYKAGFSPIDVIAEYTRPARYVENGHVVIRPALSDPELIDFPKVGTLEAFNTDGLRTLAQTIDAPNLKEKTLRYPGHIEKMAVLRETGFFDSEPIDVGGVKISPIDFTSKLLFPMWKLKPGDVDITVMRVIVEGQLSGRRKRIIYDLFDRYDAATGVHSMARTTGYTATVALRMLMEGLYTTPGITPPEYLGRVDTCTKYILDGLRERGVVFEKTVQS